MSARPDSAESPFSDVPDPLGAEAPAVRTPVRLPGRRPTRRDLRTRRHLALIVAVAWLGAELAWFGLRGDLARVSTSFLLTLVAAPLVVSVLCLVVAQSSGRLGVGARLAPVAALALAPPALMLLALFVLPPAVEDSPPGEPVEMAYCFNVTLGLALLPMLAAGVALRRSFAALAGWRSALLGSAAGLAAAALVNLHCDRVGLSHLAFGHVGGAVAVALLGAAVLVHFTKA